MIDDQPDASRGFTVALIGDSSIGKTCLAIQFQYNKFDPHTEITVGATYFNYIYNYNGEMLKVLIQDTAGQEKYRSLTPKYYRQAKIIIMCFDMTQIETLYSLESWYQDIQEYNNSSKLILVGTKCDMDKNVPESEIEKYQQKFGATYYYITSSKTGENIDNLKAAICKVFVESENDLNKQPKPTPINIGGNNNNERKFQLCC